MLDVFDNIDFKNFIARYSHLSYIKFKSLQLLKDYKKVIFIDLDVILYNGQGWDKVINLKENFIWRNGNNFKRKFGNPCGKPVCDIDVNADTPTPNGGFFIVNDNFNYDICYRSGVDFLRRYISYHRAGLDELVLAYIVKKHNLSLFVLDINMYNTFPHMVSNNTLLCHFMGKRKPWNDCLMQAIFPEWMKNYEEFLRNTHGACSTSVSVFLNAPGNVVKKEIIRDRWQYFFDNARIKIPRILNFNPSFNNLWVSFSFNDSLYYEVKFNFYQEEFYSFGVWLYEPKIIDKKRLKKILSKLNPNLRISKFDNRLDGKIVYISTSTFNVIQASSKFYSLWKSTRMLRIFYVIDSFVHNVNGYFKRKIKSFCKTLLGKG